MNNLKSRYQSGDKLVHLQVHNIWPILGLIGTIISLVFTTGQLYNRFTMFEQRLNEYQVKNDNLVKELNQSMQDLDKLYMNVENRVIKIEDRMPSVKGVSTRSATTSAEPLPIKK